jgi:hypothetical protein
MMWELECIKFGPSEWPGGHDASTAGVLAASTWRAPYTILGDDEDGIRQTACADTDGHTDSDVSPCESSGSGKRLSLLRFVMEAEAHHHVLNDSAITDNFIRYQLFSPAGLCCNHYPVRNLEHLQRKVASNHNPFLAEQQRLVSEKKYGIGTSVLRPWPRPLITLDMRPTPLPSHRALDLNSLLGLCQTAGPLRIRQVVQHCEGHADP